MLLNQEKVILLDGSEIIVNEADFPAASLFRKLQEDAKENPPEDPILQSFRSGYFPILAASSSREPTLEEAFKLLEVDPEGIDEWYRASRRLNPDWFGYEPLDEKTETITFRDGLQLTIRDCRLPSIWYKLAKASKSIQTTDDKREQSFAWAIYPKLLGCSEGEVPTEQEAYHFPNSELNKWFESVDRINPRLFKPLKDQQNADELKKKEVSASK